MRTGNGAQVFQGTAGGIVTALNAAYRPSAIVTVVEVNVLTVALTAYKDSSNVNNLSQQNAFANQMLNRLDELESQQRQIDDQIIALPGCY